MSKTNLDENEKDKLKKMGIRFKTLRESKGLTQRDLADRTDFSEQSISRIENYGKNITILSIEKYAMAFGMSVLEFINEIWKEE